MSKTNPTEAARINETIARACGYTENPEPMDEHGYYPWIGGGLMHRELPRYTTDATALLEACKKLGYWIESDPVRNDYDNLEYSVLLVSLRAVDGYLKNVAYYASHVHRGSDLTMCIATALADAIGKGKE